MKRPRRRQTVALELAALVVVLVSTSALNASPAIGAVGAAIAFLAASFSRHQRHGCERLRSLRVLCIGAIAGLAAAAFVSRAAPLFLVALAVLAGLVWMGTDPDVHRALSARLGPLCGPEREFRTRLPIRIAVLAARSAAKRLTTSQGAKGIPRGAAAWLVGGPHGHTSRRAWWTKRSHLPLAWRR
jgi:hypothetical protein